MMIKSLLQKMWTPKILFPFYHAVTDRPALHYRKLYDARKIKDFLADLDCFLNFGDPVSLSDLLKMSRENYYPGNYFLLSFDDGLREIYEIAMPLMLEKKIIATLFINPDFIDNKTLFYRYKAALLTEIIENNPPSKLSFSSDLKQEEKAGDFLMNIKYPERNLLDQLARELDFDFNLYLEKETPFLSQKELLELHESGFDIAAHSMDHPHFPEISLNQQLEQAHQSMDFVQTLTDSRIRAFAFPFSDWGVSDEFFEKCDGDLTFGTAKIKQDPIQNHFQRLSFEQSGKSGSQILRRELFAYLVKRLIGQHRTKRR